MIHLIINMDNIVQLVTGQTSGPPLSRPSSFLLEDMKDQIDFILLNFFADYPVEKVIAFGFGEITDTFACCYYLNCVDVPEKVVD